MKKFSTRFGNVMSWFKRSKKKTSIETDPAIDGGMDIEFAPVDGTEELLPPAKKEKITRETALAKLQDGYDQVVDLLGNVRTHMEQQSQRSERLLTMLEGMPEALKTLPEVTRNQTRTLEAIQGNLENQTQHNARLADALNGLSRSTEQHEHAMTAIGQQLDAGQQTSERMLDSFGALGGTLNQMSHSNEASADMLRRIAEQDSQAAEQVRELFVRNQKHMTTMSMVSWSLAIVALTVAGWVAVSVTQVNSDPGRATPVSGTPAPTDTTPPVTQPVSNTDATQSASVDLFDDHVPNTNATTDPSDEPAGTTLAAPIDDTTEHALVEGNQRDQANQANQGDQDDQDDQDTQDVEGAQPITPPSDSDAKVSSAFEPAVGE